VHKHLCIENRDLLNHASVNLTIGAGAIVSRGTRHVPLHFCHAPVCLSVSPSVTPVYCIKPAERIIEILSRSDRPIILVFRHQGSLRKSNGFTPNGGAKYKGVAIFDQYVATSRKR